ncbi:MAG: sulfatase [Verrucomicrobiae bacterium]|nr:sulfatase [Verrucomicrobiae bacterium]
MSRPLFLSFPFIPLAAAFLASSVIGDEPTVKNVLFIVSDDLKASVLNCYGDQVCQTPNIDRLASTGMVFERAYCQGTVCGPSRTSFMHSRYFGNQGLTLGENFIMHDAISARVGKIFHMKVPGDIIAGTNGQDVEACWTERYNAQGKEAHTPGNYACLNLNIFTDSLENRESTAMKNRMFVTVSYEGDGSDQPDWKAATQSMALLKKYRDQEKPFFLATGFVRPHYPSVAPVQYFEPYPHQAMKLPYVPDDDHADMPKAGISSSNSHSVGIDQFPENQQRMWAAYYATVTFMDEQVGRLLDELERLGLRESTAIVFASDHGYHLGEHHFWQKSNLHEEVIRVPLIISVPGFKAGRSESIVELMDIYPTICDLTGMKIPDTVQGKSLVPILKDPKATVKQVALSKVKNGHSLRTQDWAYMRYQDGSEELYQMSEDGGQFTNLAKMPEHAELIQKLRDDLKARLEQP